MAFEKIVVNGKYEYECQVISLFNDMFDVTLRFSDTNKVVEELFTIEYVDIYNSQGLLRERVTDYNTYSTVTLLKGAYSDENGIPFDTIRVAFKKTSVEEKVRELDKKVNCLVDEESMSLDEFREYRISKIGEECRNIIEQGLDIETSKGVKHFTYKQDDQFNVKTLFDSARMIKMDVPFHSSKNSCTVFTWQDAINIYIALESNLLYHTTYCNALFMYIRNDLQTKEEISKVVYGQEVPESRKAEMDIAINAGKALMEAVLKECGMAPAETPAEENTEGVSE